MRKVALSLLGLSAMALTGCCCGPCSGGACGMGGGGMYPSGAMQQNYSSVAAMPASNAVAMAPGIPTTAYYTPTYTTAVAAPIEALPTYH